MGQHPNSLKNLMPPWSETNRPQNRAAKKRHIWTVIRNLMEKECPELLELMPDNERRALKAILTYEGATEKLSIREVMAAKGIVDYFARNDFRYFKEFLDRSSGTVAQAFEGNITTRSELETMSEDELLKMHMALTDKLLTLGKGRTDTGDRGPEGDPAP